jgi:lysophospholipase L1-like esterase
MRRVLANLALLALSLAFAAGASELVLRARFGAPPAWTFPQESYLPDAEVGFWMRPGHRAFTHDRAVEINRLGLRDRDHPRVPPPGVRRLLALGDSQTFGNGLALADTWPKQLERELQRRAGAPRWEVVNGGLPGSATWQQEIVLRRVSDAYALHGFVLGFYVNDVLPLPDSRQVAATEITNTGSKRAAYLLKRSALFVAAWEARHPLRAWLSGERSSWEETILTGVPDARIEAGWRQVELSLADMKRLAAERGLDFWLLALPRRDQVAGAQAGRAYQRRLAELCARLGLRFFDALPVLEAAYAEHGDRLFIPWDGHNSALANAAIARALARAIAGD